MASSHAPKTCQMVIVMLSNEEQIDPFSLVMPGSVRKVVGSDAGPQFDLAFAGCARIAEDGPDLLGIMFKLDVLVWSRSQRLRFRPGIPAGDVRAQFLRVVQVARILLNRPFSSVL
jgi:hypothetical protein